MELGAITIPASVLAAVEAEIGESVRVKQAFLRQCSCSVAKIAVAIVERSSMHSVYDVTGTGNTALGVFALAIASGVERIQAAHIANVAAGIAVGKPGTACVTMEEFPTAIKGLSGTQTSRPNLSIPPSRRAIGA